VHLALVTILSVSQQDQDLQIQLECQDQWVDQPDLVDQVVQDLVVLEVLDLVALIVVQVVQDLVVQEVLDLVALIVVPEILVAQDLVVLVALIVVLEILVDLDLVDQIVDQEVLEVLAVIAQLDQVVFQQCLEFNHRVVPDNAVEQEAAVTQPEHLVAKEGPTKNVQNQNVKSVKNLKISWKHHNLVVCNYQKVMAEQFV
jgi:hypothetical protein